MHALVCENKNKNNTQRCRDRLGFFCLKKLKSCLTDVLVQVRVLVIIVLYEFGLNVTVHFFIFLKRDINHQSIEWMNGSTYSTKSTDSTRPTRLTQRRTVAATSETHDRRREKENTGGRQRPSACNASVSKKLAVTSLVLFKFSRNDCTYIRTTWSGVPHTLSSSSQQSSINRHARHDLF